MLGNILVYLKHPHVEAWNFKPVHRERLQDLLPDLDITVCYSSKDFFDWLVHDKGYARKLTDFGKIVNPEGIRCLGEMPNLTEAMHRAGWGEAKIRKVMGENWLRVLKDVWGE